MCGGRLNHNENIPHKRREQHIATAQLLALNAISSVVDAYAFVQSDIIYLQKQPRRVSCQADPHLQQLIDETAVLSRAMFLGSPARVLVPLRT